MSVQHSVVPRNWIPINRATFLVAIRNEQKRYTWDFNSKVAFVCNKGMIVYLSVQSLCERGRKNLFLACWRLFCWHSTTGYCPFHPVPVCSLSLRSVNDVHCYSVLPVGGTVRLCVTNNGSKFSTAVQCRSTLVRHTNSDTCVAGSAATGTRVSSVLCTEHGGVSCCPPIHVSVTGMLGPAAACISAQNK